MFDSAEDGEVYTLESEITDFDKWTPIKRPLIPERAFAEWGDEPDPGMWDIVVVPSDGDELRIFEGDEETPLELASGDRDQRDTDGPRPDF